MNGLRERVAFVKALKACPSTPKDGECQYVQGMEVLGVYIAHTTVSRMVAEGRLAPEVGAMLNSALATHSFVALHSCTHGAVSMHAPEHEAWENTVNRLACLPAGYDYGYTESHKRHHNITNVPGDPDWYYAYATLPQLGQAFRDVYSDRPEDEFPVKKRAIASFHWDNHVGRLFGFESIRALKADTGADPTLRRLGEALEVTHKRASSMCKFLLVMFFGRYPHRNGTSGQENEVDSYYATTFRGSEQVDLWMNGEGSHHIHHAKNDISYTHLARVSLELEQDFPAIKAKMRAQPGTNDREDGSMPDLIDASVAPPNQRSWRRTVRVERAIDDLVLRGDAAAALEGIAATVIANALETVTTADFGLLRSLHARMGMAAADPDEARSIPLHCSTWADTVWSDATQRTLRELAPRIQAEVSAVGRRVGMQYAREHPQRFGSRADIKDRFVELFSVLGRVAFGEKTAAAMVEGIAAHLPAPEREQDVLAYLQSPVPKDFIKMVRDGKTSELTVESLMDKGETKGGLKGEGRDVGSKQAALKTLANLVQSARPGRVRQSRLERQVVHASGRRIRSSL